MRFIRDRDVEQQLETLLNDGLNFQDNFQGALLEVELDLGENEVSHALGYVPMGYIVIMMDAPAFVYATRIAEWTNQVLYLASSVTSLKVRLFVM